jgi:hypothetical protein
VYTLFVVIGAALMATGVGHLIASTLQLVELQSEVNERLPQSEKVEPLFWTLSKRMQLRSLQKNLLPQSPRFGKAVRFGVIGACVFFSGVAMLLFGLRGVHKHVYGC